MIKRLIIHDKVILKSGDAPQNHAKLVRKSLNRFFGMRNAAQRWDYVSHWAAPPWYRFLHPRPHRRRMRFQALGPLLSSRGFPGACILSHGRYSIVICLISCNQFFKQKEPPAVPGLLGRTDWKNFLSNIEFVRHENMWMVWIGKMPEGQRNMVGI